MASKESFGAVSAGRATPLFPAAIRYGDLLLLSGQAPLNPATGAVVSGDFRAQARQVLASIADTLAQGGSGMADVLRVVCNLARAEDFAVWNEEFA